MFHIKICGVTRVEDARLCTESGADAIGLNFYPPSARCVSREAARTIADSTPGSMAKVGVFVNATSRTILETFDHVGLDIIQLHGDETPEMIRELGQRRVIKAFRCKVEKSDEVLEYLQFCRRIDVQLAGLLLDAHVPGKYGGTGLTLDWQFVSQIQACAQCPFLVLAGGLTAENVDQAIRSAHPSAVDTASGVECAPGVKDPNRTRAFIQNAIAAFAALREERQS